MEIRQDLWNRFQNLRTFRQGNRRAPHKPLLVLWAIGRCLRGERRWARYSEVDAQLTQLIRLFGPHYKSPIKTEVPFWRLSHDKVWELDRPHLVKVTNSGDPSKPDLKNHDIHGGLLERDYAAFRSDPLLAQEVAVSLVARHFPPILQDEVLVRTGIPPGAPEDDLAAGWPEWVNTRRRWRDPAFRQQVLLAYEHRCAVCEFSGRLFDKPLALEAAHIQWHAYRGPAVVRNGLALCTLHHELFDWGAFTILPSLQIKVAQGFQGAGVEAALGQYDGRSLRAPPREEQARPGREFLSWHMNEVFRGRGFPGSDSSGSTADDS